MKQNYVRKRLSDAVDGIVIMQDSANLLDPGIVQLFDDKRLSFKNSSSFGCRSAVSAEVLFPLERSTDASPNLSGYVVTVFAVDTAPQFPRRRFSSYFRPPECTHAYLEENEVVSHVKSQSHSPTWNMGETLGPYVLRLDRTCRDSSLTFAQ